MAQFGPKLLNEESISARTASNSVALGTRRREGGKDYLYVYNATTQFVDIGRGVRIASGAAGYTVDVATPAISTLTGGVCAGVCQDATIPTAEYGWVQTRGKVAGLQAITSAPLIGEAIWMAASGAFRRYSAATAMNLQVVSPVGRASITTTNTGTFSAFIDCKIA